MESSEKIYFPLFIDLSDKKIVVIGAGNIASRRVSALTDFCRDITVIAPEASDEIKKLAAAGKVKLINKKYESADIYGAYIVLAATDDAALNKQIHDDCKRTEIMVNVSTDKSLCDFYFPGIAKKGSMVAGISASGASHKKARLIREAAAEAMERIFKEDQD